MALETERDRARAQDDSVQPDPRTDAALDITRMLSVDVGARPPCSDAEKQAGRSLVAWLGERGVQARLESFRGYRTFAQPYGVLFAAGLVGAALQRRGSRLGDALTIAAAATGALEDDLRVTPLSRLFSRRPSVNLVARVPAAGAVHRRVCLVGHMDTTRAGLMFHPAVIPHLRKLLLVPAVSGMLLAAGPLLRRVRGGRSLHAAGMAGYAYALAMLLEREIRGREVAGANDNASGSAVAVQLIAEYAARPLEHTEVDLLITSCEESGLLGAQAYARAHGERADGTAFVNFDTVAGDFPLTFILREGGNAKRPASPRLVSMLCEIATRRPDLQLEAAETTFGLPTDASVMRARGHEAVTLLAQGPGRLHYHWPTDTYQNVAPGTIARALETGRELIAALDRSAADS